MSALEVEEAVFGNSIDVWSGWWCFEVKASCGSHIHGIL